MAKSKKKEVSSETSENTAYRVLANNTGKIETINFEDAVKEISGAEGAVFTEEVTRKLLTDGDVGFTETYYYSTDKAKLAEYELKDEVPELQYVPDEGESVQTGEDIQTGDDGFAGEGESKNIAEPTVGDVLYNEKQSCFGLATLNDNGKLVVHFEIKSKPKVAEIKKGWQLVTEEQLTEYQKTLALVKPDDAIQGIVELPMTEDEVAEYKADKAKYLEVEGLHEQLWKQQSKLLNKFRQNKFYRADGYKTFGEFAFQEFGISRGHAQVLAMLSGDSDIVSEALEGVSENVQISFNTMKAITQQTSKMAEDLGLSAAERNVLKPLIANTARLLADTAPKDDKGRIIITPRIVDKLDEVLRRHVLDGVVEIDGKQMTLEEASKAGVLNQATQAEVIQATSEAILQGKAVIRSEAITSYEQAKTPIVHKALPESENTEYYKGKTPVMDMKVNGEDVLVSSMANGQMEMSDTSRWHIDAESGKFVCFEYKGKRIRR